MGGLHQRSGVALPTGGRADPAVGNEALAGTRRSVFISLVPGARCYPTLKPRQSFSTLKPRSVEHTQTHTDGSFFGMYQFDTRFARIKMINKFRPKAPFLHAYCGYVIDYAFASLIVYVLYPTGICTFVCCCTCLYTYRLLQRCAPFIC